MRIIGKNTDYIFKDDGSLVLETEISGEKKVLEHKIKISRAEFKFIIKRYKELNLK